MVSVDKSLLNWHGKRQLGFKQELGDSNSVLKNLYSSITCVRSWNPKSTVNNTHHGGIFNFDFSPDGSVLVAACQRRSILMFDPYNGKLLTAKNQAHNDCVNCVRFLDSRTFATCSDDTTVCLWDARYLKTKMRTLRGHSEWVKNIEYASNKELLVTSGFDGSIYTWDINRYSENEVSFSRAFHTNGLMRTKLTPDNSKLIIATTGGYLMVVHNLDLTTLSKDLQGFRPNMYRLMQMSGSPLRQGYMYNHVFEQETNQVQLISDFPRGNEAEMIASLEVHPQGWCVVSRNTSRDNKSEWTCIHDIQHPSLSDRNDEPRATSSKAEDEASPSVSAASASTIESGSVGLGAADLIEEDAEDAQRPSSPSFMLSISVDDSLSPLVARASTLTGASNIPLYVPQNDSDSQDNSDSSQDRHSPDSREADATDDSNDDDAMGEASYGPRPERTAEDNWLLVDPEQGETPPSGRRLQRHTQVQIRRATQSSLGQFLSNSNLASFEVGRREVQSVISSSLRLGESVTFIIQSGGSQVAERTLLMMGQNPKPASVINTHKIHQNPQTLTHFIEEPNLGQGFIKEVSFSNDGRLVCSPFSYGLRLLAFQPGCQELCDCESSQPHQLYELTSHVGHSNIVVTTKFSPTSCLLVSGCLDGRVNFLQPHLS